MPYAAGPVASGRGSWLLHLRGNLSVLFIRYGAELLGFSLLDLPRSVPIIGQAETSASAVASSRVG